MVLLANYLDTTGSRKTGIFSGPIGSSPTQWTKLGPANEAALGLPITTTFFDSRYVVNGRYAGAYTSTQTIGAVYATEPNRLLFRLDALSPVLNGTYSPNQLAIPRSNARGDTVTMLSYIAAGSGALRTGLLYSSRDGSQAQLLTGDILGISGFAGADRFNILADGRAVYVEKSLNVRIGVPGSTTIVPLQTNTLPNGSPSSDVRYLGNNEVIRVSPDGRYLGLGGRYTPTGSTTRNFLAAGTPTGLTPIAVAGRQAPGLAAGVNLLSFHSTGSIGRSSGPEMLLSSGGHVAFYASVSGSDGVSPGGWAIFCGALTSPTAIVRSGDTVPWKTTGWRFGSLDVLALNSSGVALIRALWNNADTSEVGVVAFVPGLGLQPLLASGMGFDVETPGLQKVIATVAVETQGYESGALSDDGRVLLALTFTDGTSALVETTIPAPFSAATLLAAGCFAALRRRR
jgi:hypothetical protein